MATHLHERSEVPLDGPVLPEGRRRRRGVIVSAALVLVAAAIAVVVVDDDNETTSTTTPTTATSLPPSSATTAPTTVPTTLPSDDLRTAVFPVDGQGFDDPVDAANAFALELGFRDPVVGEFLQGDSRSGEVEVRPTPDGPVTTVFVRQLGSANGWFVLGSATASIVLESPTALEPVSSPVRLRGQSTAFEANVDAQILQDVEPRLIGHGFVMGGANGEMGPFDGTVSFSDPSSEYGSIVMRTVSMEDGSAWEASVVRVQFASDATMVVQVFFHVGEGDPVAFPRTVPTAPAVLHVALEQLLAGPTEPERQAGATSWFSAATADMFQDVTLDEGVAVVDFGDLRTVIPNASSSAGSAILLSELDATVFQFDGVDSVIYRIDGDADAFYEWLQLSAPSGA